MMNPYVSTCEAVLKKLAFASKSWGEFVVRATDYLRACLADNDISYWEYIDLDKTIHDYWHNFTH